ncbi:hypothetical protein N9Z64_00810 [bacterium]|nr:hypothetical protein [bacterium]MDB4353248.1 hypothetical protein [bacterium]MDB4416549.1 hypothetical protein [bacterium]
MDGRDSQPKSDFQDAFIPARGRMLCLLLLALLILGLFCSVGCRQFRYRFRNAPPEQFVPNPLDLPAAPDAFVWSQVIDAVDDYFPIIRETPVQNADGFILDGRVETAYAIGASCFEPWRKDSTPGFERWQGTLQSIRRRAIVTVRPRGPGYTIEVVVQKDLEDVGRSVTATESSVGVRYDSSIERRGRLVEGTTDTLGWIPLGRDSSLEQVILTDIFGRITQKDAEGLLHH